MPKPISRQIANIGAVYGNKQYKLVGFTHVYLI